MQILVGITGGIAAYKAVSLVRLLTEAGHQVKALPTANALRFIGAATLEAISHNTVDSDLYSEVDQVKHIKLAQEADLVIVAPATAAFLARYANGLADDLLLNVLLATKAKILLAPAMHTEMWQHEATQENLRKLKARGVEIAEPGSGRLTGSDSGIGRMMEPEDILKKIQKTTHKPLLGKHVVIAAGGTQEPIDDVRFIGNSSSGKQAVALAEEALARGAKVTFIDCNVSVPIPIGVTRIPARTAKDLQFALEDLVGETDILIMPVAVSDFSMVSKTPGKISRTQNETLHLELTQNPDIIRNLQDWISANHRKTVTVAFAAETATSRDELIEKAKQKFARKGVDILVANDVTDGMIFGSDNTSVIVLNGESVSEFEGTKGLVSSHILESAQMLLKGREVG